MNNFTKTQLSILLNIGLEKLFVGSQVTRTIRTDISPSVAKYRSKIDVELPTDDFEVLDYDQTDIEIQGITTNSVEVVLDQYKHIAFTLTDTELEVMGASMVLNAKVEEALNKLGKNISEKVLSGYKEVYNFVGEATENAYNTKLIFQAVQKLKDLGVSLPNTGYFWGAFGSQASLDFSQELKSVDKGGNRFEAILQSGVEAIGIISETAILTDRICSNLTHTAGTASDDVVTVSVAALKGAKSLVLAGTNGKTFVKGDLFTIEGVKGQFVVAEDEVVATGVATVTFEPALPVAVAEDVAVSVVDSHYVNLVYHPDWQIFGMRQLMNEVDSETQDASSIQRIAVDPLTGMSFKFEAFRKPEKQSYVWMFFTLYGTKVIRPELCVRVLSTPN
jgi:hypothetical protein